MFVLYRSPQLNEKEPALHSLAVNPKKAGVLELGAKSLGNIPKLMMFVSESLAQAESRKNLHYMLSTGLIL
jgi:hypothetical protein